MNLSSSMQAENQAIIGRRHYFSSGNVVGHEMAFHGEMINTAWTISVVDIEKSDEVSDEVSVGGSDEGRDDGESSGCGVCVTKEGLVLTSEHVARAADDKKLVGSPYSDLSKVYDLDLVCRDVETDLAFVAVVPSDGGNGFHYASLAADRELHCGMNLYCILGKPQLLDFAMVSGFISYDALWQNGRTGEKVHHRLSIPSFGMQGMSGSPAFDCYGRITGIVGGVSETDPLMAPIKCIRKMIKDNRATLKKHNIR